MQPKIINYKQHKRREQKPPNYFVYMVRVWSESEQNTNDVRLTAEDTRTGQRSGFTSWEELVQHLRKHTIDSSNLQ